MLFWKDFIKAGNAIFTVHNKKTNGHFTYKVKKCKSKDLWFVSVLTGPDNRYNYSYIGTIFPDGFRTTHKSRLCATASSVVVFDWLLKQEILPDQIQVEHCGRCGRCGRLLTVPESIAMGYGPECAGFIPAAAKDSVDARKLRQRIAKIKQVISELEVQNGRESHCQSYPIGSEAS